MVPFEQIHKDQKAKRALIPLLPLFIFAPFYIFISLSE